MRALLRQIPPRIADCLRRFSRDESGVLVAETLVMLPLLIWAWIALLVYWDAYRAINTSQKAAYTISDMISREGSYVLPTAYITGMRDVMKYLVDTDQNVRIRVSSVTWSQVRSRYEVNWSVSPESAYPALTTASLTPAIRDHIPILADGDHLIVVETAVDYHPITNGFGWVLDMQQNAGQTAQVGHKVQDMVLKQFITTRLRAAPKICMTGFVC